MNDPATHPLRHSKFLSSKFAFPDSTQPPHYNQTPPHYNHAPIHFDIQNLSVRYSKFAFPVSTTLHFPLCILLCYRSTLRPPKTKKPKHKIVSPKRYRGPLIILLGKDPTKVPPIYHSPTLFLPIAKITAIKSYGIRTCERVCRTVDPKVEASSPFGIKSSTVQGDLVRVLMSEGVNYVSWAYKLEIPVANSLKFVLAAKFQSAYNVSHGWAGIARAIEQ